MARCRTSDDATHKRSSSIAPPVAFIFSVLIFVAGAIFTLDHERCVRACVVTQLDIYS
uniref:Uncharacterized protein n=1 Tax=Arundo donax TaxID=35708 RepID=A0A0A8YRE8_ARUDO